MLVGRVIVRGYYVKDATPLPTTDLVRSVPCMFVLGNRCHANAAFSVIWFFGDFVDGFASKAPSSWGLGRSTGS